MPAVDDLDFIEDDDFDEPFAEPQRIARWRTSDGRTMRVSDMAESHLTNATNYTIRRAQGIEEQIRVKAAAISNEPMSLPEAVGGLVTLATEITECEKALSVLREEKARRESLMLVATDRRARIYGNAPPERQEEPFGQ